MITKNGVCYDLTISPYRYSINDIEYVFSSQLHLDKFKKGIKENRKRINVSLSNRFNYDVDVSTLADFVLYKKVETRGFLVVLKEGTISCPKNLILNGETLTTRKYGE